MVSIQVDSVRPDSVYHYSVYRLVCFDPFVGDIPVDWRFADLFGLFGGSELKADAESFDLVDTDDFWFIREGNSIYGFLELNFEFLGCFSSMETLVSLLAEYAVNVTSYCSLSLFACSLC